VTDRASGGETLRILPHGNDYYLFKPKALLPGTYDVASSTAGARRRRDRLRTGYRRGPGNGRDARAGIVVVRPRETRVRGWDLVPTGGGAPALSIRRGFDNEEPLWRPFPVAPGTYDLILKVTTWTKTCRRARSSPSRRATPSSSTPDCEAGVGARRLSGRFGAACAGNAGFPWSGKTLADFSTTVENIFPRRGKPGGGAFAAPNRGGAAGGAEKAAGGCFSAFQEAGGGENAANRVFQ
jgi:hypothetical protein